METNVTLIELIGAIGGIIALIFGAWVHMKVTVATLSTKVDQVRKDVDDEKVANKNNFNKLFDKIDELKDLITGFKK